MISRWRQCVAIICLFILHFSQDESEVTPEQRAATKQVVYSILYGIASKTLARKKGISQQAAEELIHSFEERFEVRLMLYLMSSKCHCCRC